MMTAEAVGQEEALRVTDTAHLPAVVGMAVAVATIVSQRHQRRRDMEDMAHGLP